MLNTNILAISAADPLNFGPLIYGFVILLAAFGALVGFWRGFMRQTVRSITILISGIISYAVIPFIHGKIDGYIGQKSPEEIQAVLNGWDKIPSWLQGDFLSSLDAHTLKLFLSVPIALIAMPIIFVLLFIVINKILLILHKIICAFCGFKSRRNTFFTRILGFLLGCLQGAAIAGIILLPAIGIGNIAREAHEEINLSSDGSESAAKFNETYEAYAKSVSEHPLVFMYGILGVDAMYERISTARVDGEETKMAELLPDALIIAADVTAFGGCDPKSLTSEEEARILSMLKRVEGNPIMTDLIASAVRSGSYAYENGSFPVTAPDPFNILICESLEIFRTTTPENLSGDLKTLSDIYFVLSDSGVLTAFNDGSDAITEAMNATDSEGKTTANKIIEIAKSNERMTPLLTALTKLSITAMQNGTGIDEKSFETFESIKSGINTSVLTIDKNGYENEEDYVADVSSALDETLKTNGIELEKEIVDGIADYVADNYSETKEITDEEACDIILNYYDAYLKYKETGEVPEELPNGNAAE
ncbi:MAG: CvpA family protein [Ruminococcaceae bacterium]|nr:CvpA family protein [Oscillospiraceae bacterium]